jgi:hypothetical protein
MRRKPIKVPKHEIFDGGFVASKAGPLIHNLKWFPK